VAIQFVSSGAKRRWIKRGKKERDAHPLPAVKKISVAALRKEGTGLPRRCAPRNDEVEEAFAMTRWGKGFRDGEEGERLSQ
jgi:hypothetical protein